MRQTRTMPRAILIGAVSAAVALCAGELARVLGRELT